MRDHLDAIANFIVRVGRCCNEIAAYKMADSICVVNVIRVSNDDLLSVYNIMYLSCNISHSLGLIDGCIIEIKYNVLLT